MEQQAIEKKISIFFLVVLFVWLLFIFLTIVTSLPKNPLSLNAKNEALVQQLYPQGWGFYSKDPRAESLNMYSLEDNRTEIVWPNNNMKNIFGLKRYGRAQGIELGTLMAKIPTSMEWSQCNKDAKSCLSTMKKEITIKNPTPEPTLCGKLGIAKEKLVPWAWSKYKSNSTSKVLRVNVECSKT
ncbi:SdpA family antimicrobial peptide system protein [Bacillus cereus]|uniref:SdpA family antimicrobial peptide system protein n=1 Tax=Bacillus cereus TaxID=1396 RepID=UPI003D17B757